jgi:NAD-dependent deacetylase
MITEQLKEGKKWLDASNYVVALTGAGISTESGIPDFRGPKGLWTRDPDAEKLSNIHYYVNDSAIRVKAWQARLNSPVWEAEPGIGHQALVRLETRGKLKTVITQNIDGLHQLAGSSPENVIEIHGTVREVVCLACSYRVPMAEVLERFKAGEKDPDCPACGGILKSATISFGQSLVPEDLACAEQAVRRCDVLLAVGSSLSVYPVAGLVPLARDCGVKIIIINATPTDMDPIADVVLLGNISDVLPALC